jgi:predicted secreted Zn-dependent protease
MSRVRNFWRWLGAAALSLLTLPVCAQIVAPDGPPERLRIDRERVEEVFESADLASLRTALRNAPRFAGHGQTHANFELAQQLNGDSSGCRLIDHQLRLRIVLYLPRWQPPRTLSADEQGNWPEALAALEVHEAGHAEHALEAARSLDAGLAALRDRTHSDCGEVLRAIERIRVRTLTQLELRNSLYDQVTDFGRRGVAPANPVRTRAGRRGPRQRMDPPDSAEPSSVRMRRS